MTWQSIEDLVEDLGLAVDPTDISAVRSSIRGRLAELHPDKNGGSFSSSDAESNFNKLTTAQKWLSDHAKNALTLVPVAQLPAIINAITKSQEPPITSQLSQLRTECRADEQRAIRSRYAIPKIGSGVFAAACAFFFSIGGSLKDHPMLGRFSDSIVAQSTLLMLAFYAGIFFIMAWMRERKEESYVEWLMSELGRREVFRKFMRYNAEFPTEGAIAVTIHQYASFIQAHRGGGMSDAPHIALLMFARPSITASVAEKVARLHLLQLEERGAVSQLSSPSLDTVYQVNHTVLAESQ